MAGATLSANASAPAVWFALAIARASASLALPRACPRALAARESARARQGNVPAEAIVKTATAHVP